MRTSALIVTIGFAAIASATPSFMPPTQQLAADLDSLSCLVYDDLAVYNLIALHQAGGYNAGGFTFNFCSQLTVQNPSTN